MSPCEACKHTAPHVADGCGEIVDTSWGGGAPEPVYCGCKYPRIIENFCADCFGEVWTGEKVYILGTGPNEEVAVRCERCQKRMEAVA